MDLNKIQTLSKNIRFWIFLFFSLRLVGIFNPPLEVAHNWRQTTVTMVARNFYEVSNNIFFPRIDIAGELSGITGMEFPLLNYLIYLVSVPFGYEHWYGRLINLVVTTLGLLFFHKVVKKLTDEDIAFWSTLVLCSSLWYTYGRKIMPDTFAASLGIISVFYGLKYFREAESKIKNLVLFGLFLSLATLSKLPAIVVFALLAHPMLDKSIHLPSKSTLTLTAVFCFLPTAWWYFHWTPYLVEHYGFWHFFMGKSIKIGLQEILVNWKLTLENFYLFSMGLSGFSIFVLGCYSLVKKYNHSIVVTALCAFAVFLIIIFKAGWTFAYHSYYMIPFTPFMALVAGYFLIQLQPKVQWAFTALVFAECLVSAAPHFNIKKEYAALTNLSETLAPYIPKNNLITINSGNNPTPMYFSHHKGWIVDNTILEKDEFLNKLISKNCHHVLILKKVFGSDLTLPFKVEFENDDFKLYNLKIATR